MPSEEVTHIRRRTIRSLAAPYRQSNRDGCSPQICLALFGLFVAAIGTVFGMFFFSMQFRKYNVWLGGQLEWRCSLVVCSLRYARPSSLMERALDKVLQKQYASPEMEQWATDFCNGKVELFPTLWNLNFCENKGLHSVQYKLFGAFCEHSPYSGKYIDGKIWGIMRYTSRAAFFMALLSLLATLITAAFLMKDHQTCARTKKPRWAVSEEKTGKFRPYVKICAGLAPLLLALAAVQYRWCLATFELYGGIPKQTTLVGLMGSESSEVSVAWAVVLLFAVSLLEGAMAAALLAGPLRRPERPLGLDIFDTCMDVQLERRKGKEVELSAMKASPASPGRGPHLQRRSRIVSWCSTCEGPSAPGSVCWGRVQRNTTAKSTALCAAAESAAADSAAAAAAVPSAAAPEATSDASRNDGRASAFARPDSSAQSFAARLAPRHYPFGLPAAAW
ncbi:unnamed protein product [Symbiodinium microadriaticum]|nr:unnamed protein product [Symbiodinium microadriaticum]